MRQLQTRIAPCHYSRPSIIIKSSHLYTPACIGNILHPSSKIYYFGLVPSSSRPMKVRSARTAGEGLATHAISYLSASLGSSRKVLALPFSPSCLREGLADTWGEVRNNSFGRLRVFHLHSISGGSDKFLIESRVNRPPWYMAVDRIVFQKGGTSVVLDHAVVEMTILLVEEYRHRRGSCCWPGVALRRLVPMGMMPLDMMPHGPGGCVVRVQRSPIPHRQQRRLRRRDEAGLLQALLPLLAIVLVYPPLVKVLTVRTDASGEEHT